MPECFLSLYIYFWNSVCLPIRYAVANHGGPPWPKMPRPFFLTWLTLVYIIFTFMSCSGKFLLTQTNVQKKKCMGWMQHLPTCLPLKVKFPKFHHMLLIIHYINLSRFQSALQLMYVIIWNLTFLCIECIPWNIFLSKLKKNVCLFRQVLESYVSC